MFLRGEKISSNLSTNSSHFFPEKEFLALFKNCSLKEKSNEIYTVPNQKDH